MSISPDSAAAIFAEEYKFRPGDDMVTLRTHELEAAFARAIRADRQQFAPLIQKVCRAVANDDYIAVMVAAVKLTEALKNGMVE